MLMPLLKPSVLTLKVRTEGGRVLMYVIATEWVRMLPPLMMCAASQGHTARDITTAAASWACCSETPCRPSWCSALGSRDSVAGS